MRLMASTPFFPCATTFTSSTLFSRKASSSRANCSSSTITADNGIVTPVNKSISALGDVLQCQCHPHATANTQRRHPTLRLALAHFVQQRHCDACASTADGMSQRNRAAVHIQLLVIEA